MGVYLSVPVKDKVSTNHENKFVKCGASSMQGWRVSQEDAHNCCLDFDTDVALFAVYDGHGGAEVAEYASRNLPDTIKGTEAYKQGDFENALRNAFIDFDATLITDSVLEELKVIASSKQKSADAVPETEDEDVDEDDVQGLKEEAIMPLAEVIARYANGGVPKTPALRRMCGESSKSPFLRARPPSSTSDSEVTSSSSSVGSSAGSSDNSETLTNGAVESNGENSVESTSDTVAEPEKKKTDNCDMVSSSSTVNGESLPKVSSSGRISAKKTLNIYKSLLVSEDDEESDSDENDENFSANADTTHSSDDDENSSGDLEENGAAEDDSEDEEEEEEGEEEEEEDGGEEGDEEEGEDDGEKDLSDTEEPGKDSGCTAVVSLVTRNKIIVANAGDSRAVLCRNGEAVDLSIDHKPEDPIELKRITAAGGRVTSDGRVNGGLNLSRALGDHMYKKSKKVPATEQMITALPDIKAVDLKEGEDEFIVLACDGIWNSMSSQGVVDFIRPLITNGEPLASICEQMFERCLAQDTLGDGTGCDNMTCVIVQLLPHFDTSGAKRKCEEENQSEANKRSKVECEEET